MNNDSNLHVTMSDHDVRMLAACLVEVCMGFRLDNFEEKIGEPNDYVVRIMDGLLDAVNGRHVPLCVPSERGGYSISLSQHDVGVLLRAVDESCNGLSDPDFEIRTAGTKANARAIQGILRSALAS